MISRAKDVATQVRALDQAVFDAVADTDSRVLDKVMPALSNAADHSKLWIGVGLALRFLRSRRLDRASARGLLTLGVTSAVTNQLAKRAHHRRRPGVRGVPLLRRSHRLPTSSSFPSGHSASAAAFATAVGLESAPVGVGLGVVAAAVGFSRVATGAHYPSDVLIGLGLGAGIAVVGGKLVPPLAPLPPNHSQPLRVPQPARAEGEGVVVVINPRSGSGRGDRILDETRSLLPQAEIVELGEDDDVEQVLEEAASRAEVLGIGGGDGTVCAAAVAAIKHRIPLAVLPAGTFNHFAGDLRVTSVKDVAQALADGSCTAVDVGYLNDKAFLNTASVGAYPRFVRLREKYEKRIGKPLAAILAGLRIVHDEKPLPAEFDGEQVDMVMLFIGNSRYEPRGFAPRLRTRMDDGLIDVRILEASTYLSIVKLLLSLMTGRLARDRRYHELDVPEFELRLGQPAPVARDGEVGESTDHVRVRVAYRALTVYRPHSALQ